MMNQGICAAIEARSYLAFSYDGLPREIEPHAHGTSSKGKEVVRGFQTAGLSSSGDLDWRMWDVAKMEGLSVLPRAFEDTRSGYRRGDSHMHPVHCEI